VEKEFIKYDARRAPVKKHGGNDVIHDGKVTTQDPYKQSKKNDKN
jgi:hypothetical protein